MNERLEQLRKMLQESLVDNETKDLLEELEANDAPQVVKDGEPEEGVGTTSEEDVDIDSEEYDDVDSEAAEDLQEAEELEANDAPQVVKDGEPEEGVGTTSEEDVDIDSEEYDDVDSEEADELQEAEELGANDAVEVVKDGEPEEGVGTTSEEAVDIDSEEYDDVDSEEAESLQEGEKAEKAKKIAKGVAKAIGGAAGLAAGTTKAVTDAKKEHDANKVKTEVDYAKEKLKELKKKEKDEKKDKKKKEIEELEKEVKSENDKKGGLEESVDSVNEDTLEIEPAVVDALDSGNTDGVAPIVTDVQIEPSEEDVDINIDAVTESVDSIFADIFSTLHEEELGTNDAAEVVKDGEPEEGVGTTSEEDVDIDSEEYDDVAPVTESDFTDMELMEMLEESDYEASIENVKLLRENSEIFNEFLGMGWKAAGKRLAKNQEKAQRALLAGNSAKAEKFQKKADVQLKHFENSSAKRKEKMADGLEKAARKITSDEGKSQKAINKVYQSQVNITNALKNTDKVKRQEPVTESEEVDAYDVNKAIVQNDLGASENGNNTAEKAKEYAADNCTKDDCCKDVEYSSLEEAVALGASYFLADEARVTKLTEQVALTMASENNDALFNEMVRSQAIVNRCYNALLERYINDASNRVSSLLEELEANEAPQVVKDGEPDEATGEYNKEDVDIDSEEYDDVDSEVADDLQESEELGANEAPEVVKDGVPAEGVGTSSEEDFGVDTEDYDDVDSEEALDLQEANFSRETVMSVLEESNYYQASESNVTAILESIRLGYADEIPSEIVTGLMESEEAQYKKALKKKMKLENKKNELLSKEKMITDAVKRDLYHNKIVKKVADIEAKIKVLDNEITQKAGIAEVGNDHTEDPAK